MRMGVANKRRKITMTLVAVAASTIVTALPAQAATPTCKSSQAFYWGKSGRDGIAVLLPIVGDNNYSTVCLLSQAKDSGYNLATTDVQYALDSCYGLGTGVDGYFGPATTRALKTFQRSHGLTADGIYGPATARKLMFGLHWNELARDHVPGLPAGCGAVATLIK